MQIWITLILFENYHFLHLQFYLREYHNLLFCLMHFGYFEYNIIYKFMFWSAQLMMEVVDTFNEPPTLN